MSQNPPQTATIVDNRHGSRAKILVGYGFNCFSFEVQDAGQPREVLWAMPGFENGGLRASASGIPVLFPFPGRIRDSQFTYGGKTYTLEPDEKLGIAIHGFVLRRPWRIVEQTENSVTGEFQASVDDPSLLDRWPADFRIRMQYKLEETTLNCEIEMHNSDTKPLPCGFGVHPYFRVPLGQNSNRDDCVITVPAKSLWELDKTLPTGRIVPAASKCDLVAGAKFGATQLDDVYTDLQFTDGRCTATIDDPTNKQRLSTRWGDDFHHAVVFNPPHREAFCIEPYTSVPDPFTLRERGIDSGLRELKPGETWRVSFAICAGIHP